MPGSCCLVFGIQNHSLFIRVKCTNLDLCNAHLPGLSDLANASSDFGEAAWAVFLLFKHMECGTGRLPE
jgi:hypothetical protein